MPVNIDKNNTNIGKVVFRWDVNEYEKPPRDKRWFLVMGIAAALMLIFGLWTKNYLFVLIIVLFSIILYLHDTQEPSRVSVLITELGVVIGNRFYRFGEISNFWLVYNPPEVKNLYFSLNGLLKHRLLISLLDNDPVSIKNHLAQYLSEDLEQEEEPLSDRMARLFRLG